MVRRSGEAKIEVKQMFDGEGTARLRHILESREEMYNKGRVFSHVTLNPGCEIGWHIHHGDGETYYILRGHGEYNDNGTLVSVGTGPRYEEHRVRASGSNCSYSLQIDALICRLLNISGALQNISILRCA